MEALYAKLYDKYSKLKKEKESPLDQLNREQELKFMNYAAAADEIIEYLKSENDKLRGQVDELKSDLSSTRSSSDEHHIQCQKLLMEENQKNKELLDKISKLQKLEVRKCSNCVVNEESGSGLQTSHQDSPAGGTRSKSVLKSAKKRKHVHIIEGVSNAHAGGELEYPTDSASLSVQQPACCQRKVNNSDSNDAHCLFQCLMELVVGMKVSPHSQSTKPCIRALHQSSGYSFSLTWVPNSHGEQELLYRVLSLGTFENVAPEWMKEMLMFSTSMCRIFFERLSHIIKY